MVARIIGYDNDGISNGNIVVQFVIVDGKKCFVWSALRVTCIEKLIDQLIGLKIQTNKQLYRD